MILYSKQDILNEFDKALVEVYQFLPNLEHGSFYTAGNQINLFADNSRWAVVFEKSGYHNRGLRVEVELYYYGNCLINLEKAGKKDQYTYNGEHFILISGKELRRIEHSFELISRKAKNVIVREKSLEIEQDYKEYEQKGIEIRKFDNPDKLIDIVALTRYLDEQHPELFRATDEELKSHIPDDLPKILVIKKFNMFSIYDKPLTRPSEHETFQQIADVLVTKDISKWQPVLDPNNNWRNWPEAGLL